MMPSPNQSISMPVVLGSRHTGTFNKQNKFQMKQNSKQNKTQNKTKLKTKLQLNKQTMNNRTHQRITPIPGHVNISRLCDIYFKW